MAIMFSTCANNGITYNNGGSIRTLSLWFISITVTMYTADDLVSAAYSYAALIAFIKLVASGDIVEAKNLRNDVGHLRPSLLVLMNNILNEFGEE